MAHALLSPSSAHRWLHCTAAPRLEEGVEDKGSEFAAEGSLAHAMGALKLKAFLGMDASHERQEIDMLRRYHTGEMDEYTDTYCCTMNLDEDEMASFLGNTTRDCKYYRYYDEYKSAQKQI